MSGRLSAAQHEVFRGLADAWLPATAQMPSATQAGVVDRLEHILDLRPDCFADVVRGIAAARHLAPQTALETIQQSDPPAYAALKLTILGAYYLNADVMRGLGYPGQESRPLDPDQATDFIAANLLAPVLKRGAIWRHAPGEVAGNLGGTPMTRHVFLAFTNPVPGREADFNEWQDNFHLPEGLRSEGFVRATRYKLSDAQFAPAAGRAQYLNVWEIESDELAATLKKALEGQMNGTFTDAIDTGSIVTHVYTEVRRHESGR